MSGNVSRRKLIKTGLGAVAAAGGLGAAVRLADRFGLIPANHRGIYGLSETLTYAGQRLLTKLPSMAREFDRSQISKVSPVNGKAPKTEPYQRLMAGGFADWRLTIDGMVARPSSFSLAELKSFPSRSQITHQACEEGWSFIAEWTGYAHRPRRAPSPKGVASARIQEPQVSFQNHGDEHRKGHP